MTPQQKMSEVLEELERAHALLTQSVSDSTWPFTFQREAGERAIYVGRSAITYLRDSQRDVLSGLKSLPEWISFAQLAHDNMRASAGVIAKTTFSAIAANTVSDLAEVASEVGGKAQSLLILVVVGLVALAVIRVKG